MKCCNCAAYKDLEGRGALNKRGHETKKILTGLGLVAEDVTGEHKLYQCITCKQFWQRSLDWMRGNNAYLFKVPPIDIAKWVENPFVQPDELFSRVGRIQQYLKHAFFIERNETCRHKDCGERAIKLAVFCAYHHMENIGFKTDLTENCTSFEPYKQSYYEFSINQLKVLPNYTALPDLND